MHTQAAAQVSNLGDEASGSSGSSSMSGSSMTRLNGVGHRRLRTQQALSSSVGGGVNGSSSGEAAAAREQLHDRLLPVVVGLYRADKLLGKPGGLKDPGCSRALLAAVVHTEADTHLQKRHSQTEQNQRQDATFCTRDVLSGC